MTIVYVTSGAWGAGSGAPNSAAQVDGNFFDVDQRIVGLVDDLAEGKRIDTVTYTTNSMTFHFTDGTSQVIPLPIATLTLVGEWLNSTTYLRGNMITGRGIGIFQVLVDHTTPPPPATFDPNATDGTNPLYQLWMPLRDVNYDAAIFVPGSVQREGDELLFQGIANRTMKLPAGNAGAYAWLDVDIATGGSEIVLSVEKNGAEIGTVTFDVGTQEGSINIPAEIDFAVGDRYAIRVTQSDNAEPGGLSITLPFLRTDIQSAMAIEGYVQDLLTRIINVNWSVEQFVYVGEGSPGPNLNFCTSAWSADGLEWDYNNGFRIGGETGLTCCIRGKSNDASVIMAGGSKKFIINGLVVLTGPIVAASYDNGGVWEDTGLPMLNLVIQPFPSFKGRQGSCNAVGYDPEYKTFYATTAYLEPAGTDFVWRVLMYAMTEEGWDLVSDVTTDGLNGFPLPPYPEKIQLCDNLHGQIVHTREDINYRSCNGRGQIMKGADGDGNEVTVEINQGALLINGSEIGITGMDRFVSACFGKTIIVVAGYKSNVPVVYASHDYGLSWDRVTQIQSDANGSVGAVSFS